jgi:hypothetical protein
MLLVRKSIEQIASNEYRVSPGRGYQDARAKKSRRRDR